MRSVYSLVLLSALLTGLAVRAIAQDTRNVTEPPYPPTCSVYHAPLQGTVDRPGIGPSVIEQDAESAAETQTLKGMLQSCKSGSAVELALGSDSSYNAFLVNPSILPVEVSLIIDGGVTVYGSRDPANYQDTDLDTNPSQIQCGTYGSFPPLMGCRALFSVSDDSGIYGDGIIDGQGNRTLLSGPNANLLTWWDLTAQKIGHTSGDNQSSPQIISPVVNPGQKNSSANGVVLYKITIRNPPFHTVSWGGNGLTVWGVKIQAPWNVPNTDGFDIHGTNATLYDTTVSNGDDDIAFAIGAGPTSNITVDHFNVYGRDGITLLGNSTQYPITNLLIQNLTETGDIPSLVGTTVNGVTESAMMAAPYKLLSYAQALPNSTSDIHGLNIKPTPRPSAARPSGAGATITGITFKSVCMQDIEEPINIVPQAAPDPTALPTVKDITYQDIHVLAPTSQFLSFDDKTAVGSGNPAAGRYSLSFVGAPNKDGTGYFNFFTFDNVVIDDTDTGTSPIKSIVATGNVISTLTNVFPAEFNVLASVYVQNPAPTPAGLTLSSNSYLAMTGTNSEDLAYGCSLPLPYTTGDLYISIGGAPATSNATNLKSATIVQGSSIMLNAIVQPIMSQVTSFVPNIYSSTPGLLAVGSPALSNPINFYEGSTLVGSATLAANGTLASLLVNNLSLGTHTYTAQYPPDSFYAALNLGAVSVTVVPRAATTTILNASSTTIGAGESLSLNAAVTAAAGGSGPPTGTVDFLDGSALLEGVILDPMGRASYTTTGLSAGSHLVTAHYSGDSTFSGSTSSAVVVIVTPAPVPDFSFSANATSVAVTNSAPATVGLKITPVNGFNAAVTFACSGLPAGVSCTVNPSTVTPFGSGAVNANVTFAASSLAMIGNTAEALVAFCLVGWPFSRRRRSPSVSWASFVLLALAISGMCGCGNGGSGNSPVITTITITAISQSVSHSTAVSLTYSK